MSLHRLSVPSLMFGVTLAAVVSYLDAYVIPSSNTERIKFEQRFLSSSSDRVDRGGIFRQDSDTTIININFYDANADVGYREYLLEYSCDQNCRLVQSNRMMWPDSTSSWVTDRTMIRYIDGN